MRDRLKQSDWLKEGLQTLSREGPDGLKAARIAARLKVSRGSFYWHFRDIADFKAQILAIWRARATDEVIRELDARKAGGDRLTDLLQRALGGKRSHLDQAVRAWAAEDHSVARAVAANDASRIAYIARLLSERGLPGAAARDRATFLYWAYLGRAVVTASRHAAISPSALEDLSVLFERP